MKTIKEKANITKLDIINSEVSRPFKELVGVEVAVKGAAIVEEPDENGEVKEYSYLYAEDGTIYGGNSATIKRAISNLIDLLTDDEESGEKYKATVDARKSANDREFLSLRIIAA